MMYICDYKNTDGSSTINGLTQKHIWGAMVDQLWQACGEAIVQCASSPGITLT